MKEVSNKLFEKIEELPQKWYFTILDLINEIEPNNNYRSDNLFDIFVNVMNMCFSNNIKLNFKEDAEVNEPYKLEFTIIKSK